MALTTKELKVLNLSEIPTGLVEGTWLLDCEPGLHYQANLELEDDEPIDKWILERYPELDKESSFLIHIDVDLMKEEE